MNYIRRCHVYEELMDENGVSLLKSAAMRALAELCAKILHKVITMDGDDIAWLIGRAIVYLEMLAVVYDCCNETADAMGEVTGRMKDGELP